MVFGSVVEPGSALAIDHRHDVAAALGQTQSGRRARALAALVSA